MRNDEKCADCRRKLRVEFEAWWDKLKASRYDWQSIKGIKVVRGQYSVLEKMAKEAAWEAWMFCHAKRLDSKG